MMAPLVTPNNLGQVHTAGLKKLSNLSTSQVQYIGSVLAL